MKLPAEVEDRGEIPRLRRQHDRVALAADRRRLGVREEGERELALAGEIVRRLDLHPEPPRHQVAGHRLRVLQLDLVGGEHALRLHVKRDPHLRAPGRIELQRDLVHHAHLDAEEIDRRARDSPDTSSCV